MEAAVFSGIVTQEIVNVNIFDYFIPLMFSITLPTLPSVTYQKCKRYYEGRFFMLTELEKQAKFLIDENFLLSGYNEISIKEFEAQLPLEGLGTVEIFKDINRAFFKQIYVDSRVLSTVKNSSLKTGLLFKSVNKSTILSSPILSNFSQNYCLDQETIRTVELEFILYTQFARTLLNSCDRGILTVTALKTSELAAAIGNITNILQNFEPVFNRDNIGRYYEHKLVECLVTKNEILMAVKTPIIRKRASPTELIHILNPVFANGNQSCQVELEHKDVAMFETAHYLEIVILDCNVNKDRLCRLREPPEVNSIHTVCLETLLEEVEADELRSVCAIDCIDNSFVKSLEYLQNGMILLNPGSDLVEIFCDDEATTQPVDLPSAKGLLAIQLPCHCSISLGYADDIRSPHYCDPERNTPEIQQWVPALITNITGKSVRSHGIPTSYQQLSDDPEARPEERSPTHRHVSTATQLPGSTITMITVVLVLFIIWFVLMIIVLSHNIRNKILRRPPATPYSEAWIERSSYERPIVTQSHFHEARFPASTTWNLATPVRTHPPTPPPPTVPRTLRKIGGNQSPAPEGEYIDMTLSTGNA